MKPETKVKLTPLVMTLAVLAVDQASKVVVTLLLAENQSAAVLGDFFRITLRRNPFIVFSLGHNLPPLFQTVLFLVLPVVALGLLVFFYFTEKVLKRAYRLPLAAVIGGGFGNLLDRIVRPAGVVDFFDFKFFGIFGWSRWPTFNVSDLSIVLGVAALIVIWIVLGIRKRRSGKEIKTTDNTDRD
jgi:signal peptidase II